MGAVDVPQEPQGSLVGAELLGVSNGFRAAARELGAARQVTADLDLAPLGTPASDAAAEAAPRDLGALLARLESTAAGCVQGLSRYGDEDRA
jgi:hypothetical protein